MIYETLQGEEADEDSVKDSNKLIINFSAFNLC